VGCLAERYGADLAGELPEAQVLSFDDYTDIGARLDDVLAGLRRPAHTARDRRKLLPISPAERQAPAPPAAPALRPTRRLRGWVPAAACTGGGCPAAWSPR